MATSSPTSGGVGASAAGLEWRGICRDNAQEALRAEAWRSWRHIEATMMHIGVAAFAPNDDQDRQGNERESGKNQ